jgi:hypothetical protein
VATPPGEFLVPRKRNSSSASRLPFCDVTNNKVIEKRRSPLDKPSFLQKKIPPQQSGYSEPANSLGSSAIRSLLLEYLIAELFKLLDSLSSTLELQSMDPKLVVLPVSSLEDISRASVVLFNVLSQVETIGAPACTLVPLLLKAITSALKCLHFFSRTVTVSDQLDLR